LTYLYENTFTIKKYAALFGKGKCLRRGQSKLEIELALIKRLCKKKRLAGGVIVKD